MKKQTVRKAIIPVAGMGTRFLPATKAMPKEMLTVVDKPVIQYVVEEAVKSGIEQIIFITGRGKRAIEDHFDHSAELEQVLIEKGKDDLLAQIRNITDLAEIFYVRQEQPRGLGHAVWKARNLIGDEPFAVLLGDEIYDTGKEKPVLKQLIEVYEKYTDPVIAALRVGAEGKRRYGIFDITKIDKHLSEVHGVVEKPGPEKAPSNLAIMGHYILTPDIFPLLGDQKTGVGGEIQITDAIDRLVKKRPVYAFEFEGKFYDCGSKLGFLETNLVMALKDRQISASVKKLLKSLSK